MKRYEIKILHFELATISTYGSLHKWTRTNGIQIFQRYDTRRRLKSKRSVHFVFSSNREYSWEGCSRRNRLSQCLAVINSDLRATERRRANDLQLSGLIWFWLEPRAHAPFLQSNEMPASEKAADEKRRRLYIRLIKARCRSYRND